MAFKSGLVTGELAVAVTQFKQVKIQALHSKAFEHVKSQMQSS